MATPRAGLWGVPPSSATARWLRSVRWLLPLFLAGVALFFELSEHVFAEHDEINPAFWGEVFVFAVVGPVVVALVLGWMTRLIAGYQATSQALAGANRDLESRVAERTSELSRANDELRQLDRLKSEFVSLVSHQLRAPLTNINGALELIGEDAALLPQAHRRTLEILEAEGQRLSHLIQTILDVSRVEAGRLSPHLGAVAIEPLLVRTCQSALAAEPDRPCSVNVTPGLPPAWADEVLLEEVIRNLVENAARYSPPMTAVDIAASAHDGAIQISVTDHGRGVPPEEQEMIFRSFHRVDANEAAVDGYGLGLYFADKLTRAQGGTIAVQSPLDPGEEPPGSRFTISIPMASAEPEAR